MTTIHTHPHAAFDGFPQLYRDLIAEFGTDGIDAIIEHFIAADWADFHWDGRLAEMNLGAWESVDEEDETSERVAILGYFRGRYYVATCLVDGNGSVHWMLRLRLSRASRTRNRRSWRAMDDTADRLWSGTAWCRSRCLHPVIPAGARPVTRAEVQ